MSSPIAPPDPKTLPMEEFTDWLEWAIAEEEKGIRQATACIRYQRLLGEEYRRRYGDSIPEVRI